MPAEKNPATTPEPTPKRTDSHPFRSEDISAPVRVVESDGVTVRHQPCYYRCRGLAVIDNTSFMSDGPLWSVTHEVSGASVCAWESKQEAIAAAQVLLLLPGIDWTRSMDGVRQAVISSPTARMVVATLKQGQMVVAQAGRLQKNGAA